MLILATLALTWNQLVAQAPGSANLWRVGAASLVKPPALQTGPAGIIWNPAARVPRTGMAAAIQAMQTSDIVGLSGVLVGLSWRPANRGTVAITGGRIDVSNLVRTSSSPNSEGTIPVFTQFAGLAGQYEFHGIVVGASVRIHGERFDLERDHGFTLDVGAQYQISTRLAIAAATHFLPVEVSLDREPTDYYGGIEYLVIPRFTVGRVASTLAARYGVTCTAAGDLDHMVGGGVAFGGFFLVDVSLVREHGYQAPGWRPAVSAAFRVGRYEFAIARSSGLNDLGATYRLGLQAVILP